MAHRTVTQDILDSTEREDKYKDGIVAPIHARLAKEDVITNGFNSWIVLGRDRMEVKGNEKKEDLNAAAIDIVVGKASIEPKVENEKGETVMCTPSVTADSARIYMSQKSDIDDIFGLAPGKVGNRRDKSAVALKADGVRIIGNEGVKIITGVQFNDGAEGKACGGTTAGIDLIAGNSDSDLQPMVKGRNLVNGLKSYIANVNKMVETQQSILSNTIELAAQVMSLVAASPLPPPVKSAQMSAMASLGYRMTLAGLDCITTQAQCTLDEQAFLNPATGDYILSRHNRTN